MNREGGKLRVAAEKLLMPLCVFGIVLGVAFVGARLYSRGVTFLLCTELETIHETRVLQSIADADWARAVFSQDLMANGVGVRAGCYSVATGLLREHGLFAPWLVGMAVRELGPNSAIATGRRIVSDSQFAYLLKRAGLDEDYSRAVSELAAGHFDGDFGQAAAYVEGVGQGLIDSARILHKTGRAEGVR